jgi:hypothetical protein
LISKDVYLNPILENVPRILGLLNRNISSETFGCFDREYWHYNTADFSCARKQEAVLTLSLLYLIDHEKNKYYQSNEILGYIRSALLFWTRIQNKNGSFNEWYPNENSFVATSFSSYAVSESLILIKDKIPESEFKIVVSALIKSGKWLLKRNETRVMNQQTGAAIALLNIYLLTNDAMFLDSSKDKILLLKQRQSKEGWFIEYGGPDIGYLSLAIDYLCKYYLKTGDEQVRKIVSRSLSFIKYFIQPDLVAGGEYASRNTEYLIPDGFEIFSKDNKDALLVASVVRKSLFEMRSFPKIFDDRYLTYVGYTWLQAYLDANYELDETVDSNIDEHFNKTVSNYLPESKILVVNDDQKHFIVNIKKGGAFRLYDKKNSSVYSDSGLLVNSGNKWYTSGWLADVRENITGSTISLAGNMLEISDKTLTPLRNILLRLFQMTLGRSTFISLWLKERLRDILITKAKPSKIMFERVLAFEPKLNDLLKIKDAVIAKTDPIDSLSVLTKETHIYVPSSRYYVGMKEGPFSENFSPPVGTAEIHWKITGDSGTEFVVKK